MRGMCLSCSCKDFTGKVAYGYVLTVKSTEYITMSKKYIHNIVKILFHC